MKSSINSRKYTSAESLWSLFLPVAFMLVQYGYGLGNVMLTYCILFSGYCVAKYSELPTFRPLTVYTLWYVAVLLATVLIFGHVADRPYFMKLIQIVISGFCVAIIAKHLDKEALYKSWKILGLIVCAVVAYQFFQIFVLHHSVLPIRLLPVRSDELIRNENWTQLSDRPVAFFSEPAVVVSFLTPVLFFAQQKKEHLISIFVSLAILLSGSTSGVIALVIMWGVSLMGFKLSKTSRLLLILFFFVAVYLFLNLSFFQDSIEKILYEVSGESGNADVRVLRGYWIFATLDTRSQLFGISDYDITSYVYKYASEFTWQVGYENNFYLNTAHRILIQTGLFGAVLYVWMLIRLWFSSLKVVRPYLAVVIISMFFASNFYINGLFVMQFVILLAYLDTSKVKSGAVIRTNKRMNYVHEDSPNISV